MKDQRGPALRDLLDSGGVRSYWRGIDEDGGEWWFQAVNDGADSPMVVRQLEVTPDGERHRYDVWHLEDDRGFLTDQPLEASQGDLEATDRGRFHHAWSNGAPILRTTNEAGDAADDPSEDLLHDLLAELGTDNTFLIVDRLDTPATGDHYIQVLRLDDGRYRLEHREGDAPTHRQAVTDNARVAHAVVTAWAFDLPGWRRLIPWQPLA